MKKILYIKGSTLGDVRLSKFYRYFKTNPNYSFSFWGWDRFKEKRYIEDSNIDYIYSGFWGPLLSSYILFMIRLFVRLLFLPTKHFDRIVCVNFESAFPAYLVSRFRKIEYIYEIYDEFSKSLNLPIVIKRIVEKIDKAIIRKANIVIHVDENRFIGPEKGKYIIIENTPYDYFCGEERDYGEIEYKFAVIGYFSDVRGMEQIYKFAVDNPQIDFFLAGDFVNEDMKNNFIKLKNVDHHDYMPQDKLFEYLRHCCGIFSLYNPALEINRLAASNKVYDAMMMGIPVITNPEVINSKKIKEYNVGIIVDYVFNSSWDILNSPNWLNDCKRIGKNGRKIYLEQYEFKKLVEERLLPIL